MTDLEKYEKVNKCTSLDELALVILDFADPLGDIEGRTRFFKALKMSGHCRNYSLPIANTLTREFGIRQQAMMLLFYSDQ
jgi:hypothetical protein